MQRWRYSECMYVFILKCRTADQYRTVNLKTRTISAIIDDTSAQYEKKKDNDQGFMFFHIASNPKKSIPLECPICIILKPIPVGITQSTAFSELIKNNQPV